MYELCLYAPRHFFNFKAAASIHQSKPSFLSSLMADKNKNKTATKSTNYNIIIMPMDRPVMKAYSKLQDMVKKVFYIKVLFKTLKMLHFAFPQN